MEIEICILKISIIIDSLLNSMIEELDLEYLKRFIYSH